MRKFLLFLLILFGLYPFSGYAQTSMTGKVVNGTLANRPAICAVGDIYTATDQNPPLQTLCGFSSTWLVLGSGILSLNNTFTGINNFSTVNGLTAASPIINGVNAQTGTTYTFVASDEQKLVTFNNAAAVTVTLPQATTAGFGAGTSFHARNFGVGTVTITPTTSTIDGATTLVLANGQGADIYSDGTNYQTQKGSGVTSSSLSFSSWQLSLAPCAGVTNCTQINGNLHYVIDCTSNSTTTITCPNNDGNFTSNDAFGRPRMAIGQTIWATTQGSVAGVGQFLYTTYVCPITTVASFTAQSVVLTSACTASGTANVVLYWGTKDGAALAALDATVGCAVIHVPSNVFILDDQPFLVNPPASGQCDGGTTLANGITSGLGQPAPSLVGDGASAPQAVFVISPDFNWANCKAITGASLNVCIGGTARAIANTTLWGTGLTSASNSGCAGAANKILMSGSPVASNIVGVVIGGVCPGASGMRGFELNSTDENFEIGAVISVGTVACAAHGANAMVTRETDCRNDNVTGGQGLVIDAGAQLMDISSNPLMTVQVSGQFQSRGSHITSPLAATVPINVPSGGKWISWGDYVGVDGTNPTTAATVASGGVVQLENTTFRETLTSINNSGNVISTGGGNNLGGLPTTNSGGTWAGTGTLVGTCRGTATSSATLGLYGLGQFSTPACTSTTINQGVATSQLPLSGSVIELVVNAGTGCKSGNTCVFTVMKNNSANPSTPVATALTCSMVGPASFCADNTHFDIGAAGDSYSIQFTTGAAETLANITATVLAW